ncbi:MAG TPA: penicillin-binding protein activator [Dokdonella sp.]|uniref:penicillin-binding protein activator n=1 Tax=Dokdonella sp. TaxID=2291710 RepID=UPI002D807DEC|nr:penicillin-binding protein activator [Dokdonella sp.]HET9034013.1 penicillin-binding protein activator [Dokdonella sp.]
MPAFTTRPKSLKLLILLIFLFLGACASNNTTIRPDNPQAQQAEQLAREGNLEAAARQYLALADDSRGDAAAHYRLRAAEVLRENGDLEAAARAIENVRRKRLSGDDVLRLDLIDAEASLDRGDAARASALLATPQSAVPSSLRLRYIELRARTATTLGDPFAAARMRAMLDSELAGQDRINNRDQIIETLSTLDAATLKGRAGSLRPDDALLPWIEQALKLRGESLPREVPRPQRPVGTLMPNSSNDLHREGFKAIHQVALILPLSGPVAGVSRSILDGFFAAYFADDSGKRPQVRTYDAGKTPEDALAAYQQSVSDGADFVVGPLLREAVGALFRQPLPVRVLALNHPDTGEVPPRGSAEFGLLPDAEGAQAAERMLSLGLTRAAVIAAQTDWAERAALAFRAQFESRGGTISGEARLPDSEFNYKSEILQATRDIADRADPESSGRSPPPDAGVFISMRPQQARLLLPQLKLAGINAPVFATSHINAGETNAGLDRDLNGVEFCDATWLFSPVAGRPDRDTMARELGSVSGVGGRLFAFGMDAYSLLPYMNWLLEHPETYLDGATGQLAADSFGRIHRVLTWAKFEDGIARPVQGALDPLPFQ